MTPASRPVHELQVPHPGELCVDHVGHFVPHIERARAALARIGFIVTPFAAHSHRRSPDAPLEPAGTGNCCVMLERGYLEFLTPVGDTPGADQLRAAIARYVGVHLIAFGTAQPGVDHDRLSKAGFAVVPPVALQRRTETASGTGTVRFTVVRVAPGAMAEGRIQFCLHHTPELLWQARWLGQPNRVTALAGVMLCVGNSDEAAQRYARFTGLPVRESAAGRRLDTARGALLFMDPDECERRLGFPPPALPWIAGYVLSSEDIAASIAHLRRSGCDVNIEREAARVRLPDEVGGWAILVRDTARDVMPGF